MTKPIIVAAALISAGLLAAPAYAGGEGAATATDKTVCKRFTPRGTLARPKKVCKLASEWQQERDVAREEGDRLTTRISGEREVSDIRPAGVPN